MMEKIQLSLQSVNTADVAKENIKCLLRALETRETMIWGAAGCGKFYGELLQQEGKGINFFLDWQAEMIGTVYGVKVHKPDKLESLCGKPVAVILAGSRSAVDSMKMQLTKMKLSEGIWIDGADYFEIFQESQRMLRAGTLAEESSHPKKVADKDALIVPFFELVTTTYCTLRCRHCAHMGAHYYFAAGREICLKHEDPYQMEKVLERILQAVDEVKEFSVVGGEPFLYPYLGQILQFLCHSDKVRRVEIATNGTLMPAVDAIEAMKDQKVYVTISDYGSHSEKKKDLAELFSEEKIHYRVQEEGYGWDDLGEHQFHNRNKEELKKVYGSCFDTRYKLILGSRIYDCHRVANASNLGYYNPDSSEYVEVLEVSVPELREGIKKLCRNTWIPYCNYCNGKGKLVMAALQYSEEEIKRLQEKKGYERERESGTDGN